jgi:streptogramin lyase
VLGAAPLVSSGAQESSGGSPGPSAASIREQSSTAYESLSPQAAETVFGEASAGVVDHPAGGPPPLAEGEKSLGFSSDYAESVDLGPSPSGRGEVHAVVESILPMALETEAGKFTPLDLGLREVAGGFAAVFGLVPVRIPARAQEGASLGDSGVSLTPVTEAGSPLAGGGVVDHSGVFYGDTEDEGAGVVDLSSFVKPTVGGFEWFDVLFSARSPEHLYFKVGLPEGASLTVDGSGNVQVVKEGKAIVSIPKPEASDAEGTPVATTVSLAGDVIEVSVPRKAGSVMYPIVLDPETLEDTTLLPYLHPNWVACASSQCPLGKEANFEVTEFSDETGQYAAMLQKGAIKASEWVAYQYKTQGKSKIFALEAETKERDLFTETETLFEFYAPGEVRQNWGLLVNNGETERFTRLLCAVENVNTCEASQGSNENMVEFVKRVLAEGAGGFEDRLYSATVFVSQEEAPTVTFNTTSQEIQVKEPDGTIVERENILYPGSKGWIGPHSSTAFEMTAKDLGIGVSFAVADGNTWSREVFLKNEGLCKGVQCPQQYVGKYTYYTTTPGFTSPMPSGEYEIQGRAEDEVKLVGETHVKVRVDATAPEAIKLVGLPVGNQFGEGVYKIKAEATDGKTSTPSSGVASLKLGIDGAEAGEPKGSCPAGPCTASAEWSINGGELSAGPHTLTVVATDKAGNVSHGVFVIFVHHASPMALGPGSLDPQSGNYTVGTSDVSMGAGLTLSRAYSSRNLTAGVEGGLGPQWSVSLAGSESLEELADGSMVLTAANGGETAFEKNSNGEFEAPKGDTNVTLTAEVNEKGVPVAYSVKNAAAGSTMRFARASGYLQTAPTYYGEIGWEGPGTGQLNTPMGVASDAKGDAWVSDTKNNRIEKFDPEGEYVSQFGYVGSENGALKEPRGVAIDVKGDIWVTDTGNNRVEEFTEHGEFMRVTSTEVALKGPQGIATDASGNVWVADTGDNRVVEFKEKGEYVREAAKTVGTRLLAEPVGVAIDTSGNVWVTDAKNHRVVEFGSTGIALKEFGKEGTNNGEFQTPTGIAIDSENDLYVSDYAADRVQEFNAKGEYLTKFGSAGSNGAQFKAPYLMGVDAQGALLVADSENSRVQRWAHSAWLPSVSEGPVVSSQVSYTYKAARAASGTLIEPTEVVAAHATELSCAPTIKVGCRALFLKYAEKTTATESVWGEYEGRLSEVFFAAYNPATKLVEEKVAVARYAYDAKGRLRAEWDPRVKPEAKTVYGYDAEGHVTAVSPANQEPWLIHYGTIPVDASSGRVLSVIRPAASTELGNQTAPSNTSRPALSSSEPKVGVKINVSSNGTWSNSPLTYSYQWERCNNAGLECVAIAGAVNEAYYPTTADEKHTLVLQVSAINAGGTTVASSTATGLVGAGTPNSPAPEPPNPGTNAVSTVEYAVPVSGTGLPSLTEAEVKKWGQEDYPLEGTAVFPPDKPMGWPAKEYEKATISYFDAAGRTVNVANPAGGISTVEYSETNNATRTLSADNRVLALKEGEKSVEVARKLDGRKVYNEEGDELLETLGPEHKVKLSNGSEVQARH